MFEMKIKRSKAEQAFNIFNIILMFVLMVVTLYPLLYVLFASLSDASKLMQHSGLLFKPLGLNLSSYKIVIQDRQILSGYMNTIIVVVAGVLISMVLTILGAYTLSRKNLYWGKMISMIVIIPMFFSGGLIPFYLLVKNLGMLDSLWALILPTALSTYNMMIMRTALAGVPKALEEAAEIDGANPLVVLFRILILFFHPASPLTHLFNYFRILVIILPFFFLCVRNFISFLFFRCFCETSINPGHFSHMIQRCFRNLICSKPPFPVIPECRWSIHTGFISKTQIILNRNDCKISYT